MKIQRITTIVVAALVAVGVSTSVQAQEKKGKDAPKGEKAEKKKSDTYPFNGKVASVDKGAMTVTLQGKEKTRVIKLTPETRIVKMGKPATLDEATAGETVGGLVKKDALGKEVATMLRIGPAPEGKAKGKDGEKKEKK